MPCDFRLPGQRSTGLRLTNQSRNRCMLHPGRYHPACYPSWQRRQLLHKEHDHESSNSAGHYRPPIAGQARSYKGLVHLEGCVVLSMGCIAAQLLECVPLSQGGCSFLMG